MITTLYGYKIPQNTDRGPVVFPALEDNIQRLNDHDHDGVNSKPLTPVAVAATAVTIIAANWVFVSTGIYKQVVTVPVGYDYDKIHKEFRLADGSELTPSLKRLSATQFEIYVNDNTLDIGIYYK